MLPVMIPPVFTVGVDLKNTLDYCGTTDVKDPKLMFIKATA